MVEHYWMNNQVVEEKQVSLVAEETQVADIEEEHEGGQGVSLGLGCLVGLFFAVGFLARFLIWVWKFSARVWVLQFMVWMLAAAEGFLFSSLAPSFCPSFDKSGPAQ
ncbi:hypothetical protein U1Q18_012251 [Sarracenia purpurea var. burkii]